jgi:hypothetical protein
MMHRLLNALLLKGLWKFKPIHVVVFWLFMAYQGWMASPYFMYYVVGAPAPGTAQRYVGTLRVEGELQRSKTGWIPPRYFIRTSKGEIEVHCDYLPYPIECSLFHNFYKQDPNMVYEVGYDRYWGIDFIRYPNYVSQKLQEYGAPHIISQSRYVFLKYHRTPAAIFFFAFLLYAYCIWQSYENSNPKKSGTPDASPPKPDAHKQPAELTKLKKTKSFFDQ